MAKNGTSGHTSLAELVKAPASCGKSALLKYNQALQALLPHLLTSTASEYLFRHDVLNKLCRRSPLA